MTEYSAEHAKRIRSLCKEELLPEPTGMEPRLEKLEGIRAVLFDIYGTLFVSGVGDIGLTRKDAREDAIEDAFRALEFGGSIDRAAHRAALLLTETIEKAHARRRAARVDHPEIEIREVWRELIETLLAEELLETVVTTNETLETLAIEYECRVNPVSPMPRAREVVERLGDRGLRLGIVSNAQFFTPCLFEAFFGKSHTALGFDDSFCAFSYKLREAKPSRALFHAVLKELERADAITPGETLYVGNDMLNDVWTAAQTGCRTALFAGDQRSLRLREDDPRVEGTTADLVVTELGDILTCV